ncbi:hypothetical protein [Mesobacillus zeae]|uniref:hypothetical protein n=1 Tax=Mesobacillus zeae TaxID=1917180 RepID=UPI0015E73EAE|nr:hypothetical protein [Mesobacillus zeae]
MKLLNWIAAVCWMALAAGTAAGYFEASNTMSFVAYTLLSIVFVQDALEAN